jgi:IS30 family transposase
VGFKIQDEWSPEQICGYAKRCSIFNLGHEWIYQFILNNKRQGGDLYKHLRIINIKNTESAMAILSVKGPYVINVYK